MRSVAASGTIRAGRHVALMDHHGARPAMHATAAATCRLARRRCSLHKQGDIKGTPQAQSHQNCPDKSPDHDGVSLTRVRRQGRTICPVLDSRH